jgi:transcriptional regulator with XRE-family HTH domain
MPRTELAQRSGVKYPTLAGIENGDQVGTTRLHTIAAVLSVNIGWLETGKGQKEPLPLASQALRIDASTIASAQKALASMARVNGLPPSWETDPEHLALAINTVIEVGTAEGGNVIDLMAGIADRLRKGAVNAVDAGTIGNRDSAAVSSNGHGKPKARP